MAKYKDAVSAYKKTIDFAPKNAAAWRDRGKALINLSEYNLALDSFIKAIEDFELPPFGVICFK